jgi:hypothetical protein
MKKQYFIILTVILLGVSTTNTFAQLWKRTRYEVMAITGLNTVYTDLGGGRTHAKPLFLDFDYQSLRPIIGLGARYKIRKDHALKLDMIFAYTRADDAWATDPARHNRGVSVKGPLFDMAVRYEYSVIRERLGRRYALIYFRGGRNFSFAYVNTYFFVGAGWFWMSPRVRVNGVWEPANNDNFNRLSVPKNYSHIQFNIPFGVGFKYAINREWKLALEITGRKTFTDYLDHHSDVWSRGDDYYAFFEINIIKRLKTARSGLPKF